MTESTRKLLDRSGNSLRRMLRKPTWNLNRFISGAHQLINSALTLIKQLPILRGLCLPFVTECEATYKVCHIELSLTGVFQCQITSPQKNGCAKTRSAV